MLPQPMRVLATSEKHALQAMWRARFAAHVQQATGRLVYRGFDWHAFSYAEAFAADSLPWSELRTGQAARQRFHEASLTTTRVFVLPEPDDLPGYELAVPPLPDFQGQGADVHVVPADFAWTMSFPHDDHGPYFAVARLA
jgi:hypothetical protein